MWRDIAPKMWKNVKDDSKMKNKKCNGTSPKNVEKWNICIAITCTICRIRFSKTFLIIKI